MRDTAKSEGDDDFYLRKSKTKTLPFLTHHRRQTLFIYRRRHHFWKFIGRTRKNGNVHCRQLRGVVFVINGSAIVVEGEENDECCARFFYCGNAAEHFFGVAAFKKV